MTARLVAPPDFTRGAGAFASRHTRVRLRGPAVVDARENAWHKTQELSEQPGGGVEITLRLNNLIEVKHEILRWGELAEVIEPAFRQMFYSRFRTTHLRSAYFAVRTTLPPQSIMPAARKAIAAIDPAVAITNVTTQQDVHERGVSQERLFAALGSALAGLALLLACIGLYGLMAYNVARRMSEIGLRIALGAQPRDVAQPVLREAFVLAALGIAAGLPAALVAARLVKSQLYGVPPNDPLTLIVATTTLLAITLAAAWIPARRAMRVDPLVTLRAE